MKTNLRLLIGGLMVFVAGCSTTKQSVKTQKVPEQSNIGFRATKGSTFGYKDGYYKTVSVPIRNKKGKVVGRKKIRKWVALDNGVGHSLPNPDSSRTGIKTNNTHLKGVALPIHIICRDFNLPPMPNPLTREYWEMCQPVRESAVQVHCLLTGKKEIVPWVDLGPDMVRFKKGVGIDLTHRLMQVLAGPKGFKMGLVPVEYRWLKGYYAGKMASR